MQRVWSITFAHWTRSWRAGSGSIIVFRVAVKAAGKPDAGMPDFSWCGENIPRRRLALQTKLERRAQRVDVPGMRMAVVLSDVIKLEREMFVDFLDGPNVKAVSYPGPGD